MMPNTLPSFGGSVEDLLQKCNLEAFVSREPLENYLDGALTAAISPAGDDMLSHIPRRRLFLADELFDLNIAFRVPLDVKGAVHRFLSHLTVHVAACIEGKQETFGLDAKTARTTQDASQRCFFSKTFTDKDKFRQLMTKEAYYIIWKKECHLDLPKDVSENFHVYFITTATRNTLKSLTYPTKGEEYLRSGTPLPSNILQPLLHDSALDDTRPYMSALRFTKVASSISENRNFRKPIALTRSKLYPALPILSAKYRLISYTRSQEKSILLVSIEITSSTTLNTDVRLVKVDLLFPNGEVKQRTQPVSSRQPFEIKPGDQNSLIYEIIINDVDREKTDKWPMAANCSGNIVALVDIPRECSTRIFLDCKKYIDDAIRNANTDSLMDRSPSALMKPYVSCKDYQADSNSFPHFRNQGIAITVSGPQEVRWGEVFIWNILIVNKTRAARRCRITLLQDEMERNTVEKKPEICPIVGQTHQEIGICFGTQENMVPFDLLASQRKARIKKTNILCLSPDIQIDTLLPQGCFATKLELLPLQIGRCYAGALQVTDELCKEISVIKTIPDIIVVEPE